MSFLQPIALFGFILVIAPILIHLLNRLRHRRQEWAAMRFLLRASEKSSRSTKLRHWLTLLLRMLALICLTLLIAQPVFHQGESWLSFTGQKPVTLVCVLDRSASMERIAKGTTSSLRKLSLNNILSLSKKQDSGRIVIFETTDSPPLIINQKLALDSPSIESFLGPTDTSANLPGTLKNVFGWLERESISNARICIFSDLQSSSWKLSQNAITLQELARDLEQRKGKWKLQLCPLETTSLINRSIYLQPQKRTPNFLIERSQIGEEIISIEIQSEATKSYLDLNLTSARTILNSSLISAFGKDQNWLSLSLPDDLFLFDNKAYLTLSRSNSTVSAISAENERIERILSAATQNKEGKKPMIKKLKNASTDSDWNHFDLWLLQGNSSILSEPSIQAFIDEGGTVLHFPSTRDGDAIESERNLIDSDLFSVTQWNENQGILANSSSGHSLPFSFLKIKKRQTPLEGEALAFYQDGKPFLTKKEIGKGIIYSFSTLPLETWSNLEDGFVLVPIIQRILSTTETLSRINFYACGSEDAKRFQNAVSITGDKSETPFFHAGIYLKNGKYFAFNRPALETDPERISKKEMESSILSEHFEWQSDPNLTALSQNSENWKLFLLLGILLLLAETYFSLPAAHKHKQAVHEF
tara:strand:- start:4682 stop:6613 length:1932 start_codon:yes stop_codon:yes gene_type:complete